MFLSPSLFPFLSEWGIEGLIHWTAA